jgi:hypothetical protein
VKAALEKEEKEVKKLIDELLKAENLKEFLKFNSNIALNA